MPRETVNTILLAEEMAREQDLLLKERVKKFKSHVVDWKNYIIENTDDIIDEEGEGKLDELVVIAPNDKFSLFVEIDGILAYRGDFTRYEEIGVHVDSVVAQHRGTKYIIQVNDVVFLGRIRIRIDVSAKTIFQRLFCKYNLEGEW